jgi:hypothetical protein
MPTGASAFDFRDDVGRGAFTCCALIAGVMAAPIDMPAKAVKAILRFVFTSSSSVDGYCVYNASVIAVCRSVAEKPNVFFFPFAEFEGLSLSSAVPIKHGWRFRLCDRDSGGIVIEFTRNLQDGYISCPLLVASPGFRRCRISMSHDDAFYLACS